MRRVYRVVLCCLFPIITCDANTCLNLNGTWRGYYQDHGPYDQKMLITLHWYQTKDGKLVGATVPVKNQMIQLSPLLIYGSCQHNKLSVYFLNNSLKPPCGTVSHGRIDKNKLIIDLHWENAMTGGHGPAMLYKVSSKVVSKIQLKDYLHLKSLQIASCH